MNDGELVNWWLELVGLDCTAAEMMKADNDGAGEVRS